ncbi:MAG: TMEM165/GDT1 family protein [Candidatus Wallbacteria bacterium]|nr:TMEM165/GDT1 family protein [Candidatus Wallbacteria bacterium]
MWKLFLTVFSTVFFAELGDKTQLAAFCLSASNKTCSLTVFAAASAALVTATAIGVFFGQVLSRYVDVRMIHRAGGILFIVMGCWLLYNSHA